MNSARSKVIHEVERDSHLSFLITAFIGALNKLGDALIRSNDNAEKIRQLTQRLKVQNDALDSAIKQSKG